MWLIIHSFTYPTKNFCCEKVHLWVHFAEWYVDTREVNNTDSSLKSFKIFHTEKLKNV